ncbi:MAG: DUF5017 domain-containing protein, partial [Muribaculaceae bacterium]|nr:DUF5017 domain-containing protein [Muribaculaceae bacterium]
MNKTLIKSFLPALMAVAITACSAEAPEPARAVSIDGGVCKAGEPVCVRIDGKADNIVFYSGEPGHEYSLRDRQ